MRKYTEIKFVPGAVIQVAKLVDGIGPDEKGLVFPKDCAEINEYLAGGWELVQLLTHTSQNHEGTIVVAALGKPA